jgi:hypothetical protein
VEERDLSIGYRFLQIAELCREHGEGILAGSELRHLRPRLLGQLAVAREAGVSEHLGVADDGLVEHVPGAVELTP